MQYNKSINYAPAAPDGLHCASLRSSRRLLKRYGALADARQELDPDIGISDSKSRSILIVSPTTGR